MNDRIWPFYSDNGGYLLNRPIKKRPIKKRPIKKRPIKR